MSFFLDLKESFPETRKVGFGGIGSKNPVSFKKYDEKKVISGKVMKRILILVLAIIVLGMTACKAGNDASTEDTDEMEISMMHFFTAEAAKVGGESPAMRDSIERWKAKYPNMVVDAEELAHDVYDQKLKTLIASDELPDIFMTLPSAMVTLYDNGQILDLKPLMDADEEWKNRYAEGGLGDATFGDRILGAPVVSIANHVLFWNEAIFAECGIDEFPANSEKFKEAVQKIADKGYIPIANGNKGKYPLSSQLMPGFLFKFVSAEWYKDMKNYETSWTDADPLAAITYMEDLVKIGAFNADMNSLEQAQGRQFYYEGKSAMYIEGSWAVSTLINEAPEEVLNNTNIAIFPPVVGKEDLEQQIVGGQGWAFALNSNLEGEKLDLAIALLKEINSQETSTMLIETNVLPVLKDVQYDESKLHPFYKEFLDMYNSYSIIVGCPEVQLSAQYMDASYTGYQSMSIGEMSAQELAKSLQKAHEFTK